MGGKLSRVVSLFFFVFAVIINVTYCVFIEGELCQIKTFIMLLQM